MKPEGADKSGGQGDRRNEEEETAVVRPALPMNTITLVDPPGLPDSPSATRWSSFVASPRGVMFLVPLLVLTLGVTLTIIGQLALSATSKTMAKERFVEQTATSTLRVESALAQADPLLEELEVLARQSLSREIDIVSIAAQMRDLLVARRAISQAYLAFEDGRFWVMGPGSDGQLELQVTDDRISTSFAIHGGRLIQKSRRSSAFDPRLRAWYQKAKLEKSPIWSNPYVFYFNHHPGVTRALPLYADEERTELISVVGVDFDVEALTAFMAAGESGKEGARSVVFSAQGVVLAYPHGADKLAALPKTSQVITHKSLGDEQLSSLIENIVQLPRSARDIELYRFTAGKTKMLASVRRIAHGGPEWYVASFADESTILHELHTHRARSLFIGGISLALAVAMGWWLARYILRVKNQATEAQAAAFRAQEQVRDLGSYRLISLLGEGGMGEVWRARHRLLAREAAIKLIKMGGTIEPRREEQRQRFRREAQAIAGLRSRNTVALFDYGVTPTGTLFYVMELLDGIDLSRLVARHGPQSPDRVRQIMIQVCNSLAEAHDAKLIHRDIKPANLFLCREAEDVDIVKVLDFGLVFQAPTLDALPHSLAERAVDPPDPEGSTLRVGSQAETRTSTRNEALLRITNPEHQLGTPAFMSPEQASGTAIDHRTDLYSLGCVAWWLLTGRPPYRADSQLGYMIQHIEGTLPRLQDEVPAISDAFTCVILSCLEKDSMLRPDSARQLAESLRTTDAGGVPWTRKDAERWWEAHRPKLEELRPNYSLAPLRDAEIVHPAPREGQPRTSSG